MRTRLERSLSNRVIAGVCGGLGEYLDVDPTLVRVVFVILAVVTSGLWLLGYIVLLVLMPLPGRPTPFVQGGAGERDVPPASPGDAAVESTRPIEPPDPAAEERRRSTFAYILVALGAVLLFANFGAFRIVRMELVWPLVLIGLGALLLVQRARR